MPLLIIAESIIGPILAEVGLHFLSSGRISEADSPKYREAVDEVVRLRDSKWAEGLLVVVAYVSTFTSMMTFALTVSSWRWISSDSGGHITLAAWWYVLVSIPIFQFLLYRWFFRIFIWSRFLYRMSRLDLNLIPTHPDRAGGIAFVGANQRYFGMILFALGALFAGVSGNEVMYENVSLSSLQVPTLTITVVVVFLIQLPGLFFFSMLRRTKRSGVFVYGNLALRYASEFQRKWVDGAPPTGEQLMGSSDIQSLADLGNSYGVIDDMMIVPFTWRSSIWLAAAFLFPVFPLLLTVMPLNEILQAILKLVV